MKRLALLCCLLAPPGVAAPGSSVCERPFVPERPAPLAALEARPLSAELRRELGQVAELRRDLRAGAVND